MEEIRVVQIEEIHRQIRRQICRDVSPAARLMVVIQAKHDGESWKVKLQKNVKKEQGILIVTIITIVLMGNL